MHQRSGKQISTFKTLREIRQEHQKQHFFHELMATIEKQLTQQEHQYLMEYILPYKHKERRHQTQKLITTQKRFTLLHTHNPIEKEDQSPLQKINQNLFQKKKNTKQEHDFQTVKKKERNMKRQYKISMSLRKEKQNGQQYSELIKQLRKTSFEVTRKKRPYYSSHSKRKLIKLCPQVKERQKSDHHQYQQFMNSTTMSQHYNKSFLGQIFYRRNLTLPMNISDNSFTDAAIRNITNNSLEQIEKTHKKATTIQDISKAKIKRRKHNFINK